MQSPPGARRWAWTLEVMPLRLRLVVAVGVLASLLLPIGCSSGGAQRKADRVVGLTYQDPKETQFLKAVLTSMNLQYTATRIPQGELVEWASTDLAQEQEIQNRVSQFWFISTQCHGMQPPAPTQPARPGVSC